jgi:hypothetical protein
LERGFECFYEKVKKVNADVAAFSYLFLPSRILEGWRAVEGGAIGNVHLDP